MPSLIINVYIFHLKRWSQSLCVVSILSIQCVWFQHMCQTCTVCSTDKYKYMRTGSEVSWAWGSNCCDRHLLSACRNSGSPASTFAARVVLVKQSRITSLPCSKPPHGFLPLSELKQASFQRHWRPYVIFGNLRNLTSLAFFPCLTPLQPYSALLLELPRPIPVPDDAPYLFHPESFSL